MGLGGDRVVSDLLIDSRQLVAAGQTLFFALTSNRNDGHKYIEELFGEKNVFRAGTITGVADKTAIGYAKKYCEEYALGRPRQAELVRMASGCVDVKKSTGQHAGGIVILPKKYDINEFTPLQYPSNDPAKGIITTHFTFESLHDTLLKEDI